MDGVDGLGFGFRFNETGILIDLSLSAGLLNGDVRDRGVVGDSEDGMPRSGLRCGVCGGPIKPGGLLLLDNLCIDGLGLVSEALSRRSSLDRGELLRMSYML